MNKIHCLHALEGLKQLPDNCIDCVITSPPYWGMRDYGPSTQCIWGGSSNCSHQFNQKVSHVKRRGGSASAQVTNNKKATDCYISQSAFCTKCHAWRGQLGMEPDFEMYIKHLLQIFDEIKRVLKPHGQCWVNLNDSYGGNAPHVSGASRAKGKTSILSEDVTHLQHRGHIRGQYDKCLLGLPERFILGMIDRHWTLRNKVIWYKPNHMPSSVKDRLCNSWEHLFFFTKSKKYYFDLDAIRVPHKRGTPQSERDYKRMMSGRQEFNGNRKGSGIQNAFVAGHRKGKNPGDIIESVSSDYWQISTKPCRDVHFAVFPEKLIERPIQSSPLWVCSKCGIPQMPVQKTSQPINCKCKAGKSKAIILDPFMGSGTTAIVARKHGRDFIGFEPNPEYIKIANKRLKTHQAKSGKVKAKC